MSQSHSLHRPSSRPHSNLPLVHLLTAALCISPWLPTLAQSSSTEGQPPASGREPAIQQEKDWGDNRWNRTTIGRFLASNVALPGTTLAKGLTIQVGSNAPSAVAYDTARCTLQGAWSGGFLEFDPTRFGLINTPKPRGTPLVFGPQGSGWIGSSNHYVGLHLHGDRVVLQYEVDDVQVLESPDVLTRNNLTLFSRSFEIQPTTRALNLQIAQGPKKTSAQSTQLVNQFVLLQLEGRNLWIGLTGTDAELLRETNGIISLRFPGHGKARQFKLWFASATETQVPPNFAALAADPSQVENLQSLLKPGPAHWLPEITTTGRKGTETDVFAVDTLTIPYDNPWKALFFVAGVDFTADGSCYICTIHGDVWRIQGVDESLTSLRWKRFATGLFQPLGLKVHKNQVLVLGRDQITRLHDYNNDGEADYYENFSNLIQTSTGGHDYVTCLEKDSSDNLYYVDPKGVHRVSPDGRSMETLATGFRNPNGMGVSPDGSVITAAPQQGTWTPSSQICAIKPGGYYGFGGSKVTAERPDGYDLPLCWIPHGVDNSSGSQVWVPPGSWGAMSGQMLHLLWGRCTMMQVLRDKVGEIHQGAVISLPVKFLSGPNRGSFHPTDGHLYVGGSTGWQTSAVKDGALQRVRFLNKPVRLPTGWHAHRNGITLTFAQPLDRSTAEDAGSYAVKQWNYRYSQNYGSKDWSVADPNKEGRDEVPVKSARLLPDGKTVFLDLGELKPVMQMEVKYSVNASGGGVMKSQLWLTLNALDKAL